MPFKIIHMGRQKSLKLINVHIKDMQHTESIVFGLFLLLNIFRTLYLSKLISCIHIGDTKHNNFD